MKVVSGQMDVASATRAWQLALGTFVAAALLAISGLTFADPDLWGHLRFGLDMLRDHRVAQVDPYSYVTEGHRWINHEWLSEVTFAVAWSLGGVTGLVLLKTATALGTIALVLRHLIRTGAAPGRAVAALFLAGTPLLIGFFAFVRPQIFTYLLFTLLLLLLFDVGASRRYRRLWLATPLLALWTNFHGGVLAGIGVFGLWTISQFALDWPSRWRIALPALAGALSPVVNPYGIDLPLFLLQTATVARPEIVDWQSLAPLSGYGVEYGMTLIALLAGVVTGPRRRDGLALCAITALMPWLAVRHLPLFSLVVLVFAGESIVGAWHRFLGRGAADSAAPASLWPSGLVVLAATLLAAAALERGALHEIAIRGRYYPVAPVELLRTSGVEGNLTIEFAWGEYALWHLAPRVRVGMDGRRETVYPEEAYRQYVAFRTGHGDASEYLRAHPASLALLRKDDPAVRRLVADGSWEQVFADEGSALLARRGTPQLTVLKAAVPAFVPPPPKTRFP